VYCFFTFLGFGPGNSSPGVQKRQKTGVGTYEMLPTGPPACVLQSVSRVQKQLVRPIHHRVALIYRFCPTPRIHLHACTPARL